VRIGEKKDADHARQRRAGTPSAATATPSAESGGCRSPRVVDCGK
jgi:hypothetical protein